MPDAVQLPCCEGLSLECERGACSGCDGRCAGRGDKPCACLRAGCHITPTVVPHESDGWPTEWVEAATSAIDEGWDDGLRAAAIAVLAALTEAGALQPPGAVVREQWATRIAAHDKYDEETCPVPDDMGRDPEQWALDRAAVWRRRFGGDLVSLLRRQQWTGPWQEVPDHD